MKIIGAGLSGLLAGALIPGSTIYEAQKELPNNHGAVLRFRSDKISKALNIPFKKVRVTKSIWLDGKEVEPTPRIQNMYSYKCTGSYSDRSIRDISPSYRYIAPDDFIQQLAERCYIEYGYHWNSQHLIEGPIISTIPMPIMINQMFEQPEYEFAAFRRQSIHTRVHTVPSADLYQTVYYPADEDELGAYRASFTGNKLMVECVNTNGVYLPIILRSFGMDQETHVYTDRIVEEKYGKIVDIDPHVRRSIMAELTHKYNIYSLGRFATWRNILLDDVFDDIYKIMDLVKLDSYSRRLAISEEK